MIKRIPLAKIRAAWDNNALSKAQVAAQLGIRPGTPRKWQALLGLPPRARHTGGRKLAQVDPVAFTRVWERGDLARDIARRFKRSAPTISNIARRLGLDGRNRGRRVG